jgi:hypothetical protein
MSRELRRVLIVAYHFPPRAGGGVLRPLRWTKYLPEFGWQPIVLTAQSHPSDWTDPDLSREIPASAVVCRTAHVHPKSIEEFLLWIWRLFWRGRLRFIARRIEPYKVMRWLVPDAHFSWLLPGLREGRRLIRRYQASVILSTAPPHTAYLIGPWLRSCTGIPFVADYRDPWSTNRFVPFRRARVRSCPARRTGRLKLSTARAIQQSCMRAQCIAKSLNE